MKKKFRILLQLLLPLVVLISSRSAGSPPSQEADSLFRIIAGQQDNREKADNLISLGKLYYYLNADSAFLYFDKVYDLSRKISYPEGQADALFMKSLLYRGKADYKSALDFNRKFLELGDSLQDSLRLAKGYYQQGNILMDMSDYDLARICCQKSLSFYIPLKNATGILANYNSIGSIFFDGKSEYDSAAYYYLKAINQCEQIGDDNRLSSILNNLGNVYFANGQFDLARKYFNMSLKINQKYNLTKNLALNYTNLGRVASEQDEFQAALTYYEKAAGLYQAVGDQRGIADINNNFGNLYFKQDKYDLAMEKFDEALELYHQIQFSKGIILALINKASVYSEMGSVEKAMALQDSCLLLADQLGGKDLLILALGNISDNYKRKGNFRKAFDYLIKKYELKDSIFNINKTKVINDLALKYEKEKDQAQILALEKDNLQKDLNLRKRTYQRNAYMFTGLGIIVLALFLVIYFRQRATHEKLIASQKIRQLEEEKKLMGAKLLVEGQEEERKRIATELHDGLGVLLSATKMQFSTISDKSPENKVLIDKATRMLEQATGDVRKISHNMMPGLLTKLGFFEAVEDLFEHIGDTKDLNVACNISGNQDRLSENKEIMLYRIVQEMVNNSLKHAEARNIELQIDVIDGKLDLKYSDDGKGFDIGSKMESESIGLKSIQSRVNFLNGTLGIESEPGKGTRYSVRIPV